MDIHIFMLLSESYILKIILAQEFTNKNLLMMNKTKLNVYKKVLQKVCEKSDGAEEVINQKIEEICY